MTEQVVPGSIIYSDLKPEAIKSEVNLVKYYPSENVTGRKPGDQIRFMLKGNGFMDPYSSYMYFKVKFPAPAAPATDDQITGMFLDRSAHSLIKRLTIRSEGTELERIENYSVMAAMIDDVTFTPEMKKTHHFEGRNCTTVIAGGEAALNGAGNAMCSKGAILGDVATNGSVEIIDSDVGHYASGKSAGGTQLVPNLPLNVTSGGVFPVPRRVNNGCANLNMVGDSGKSAADPTTVSGSHDNTVEKEFTFCIPLYSGIIGLFMPEKKMIPLSYVPLEIELTLNEYAMYGVGTAATREYTVSAVEFHSHILTFQHEISRQLDTVVASQGLFIPFETMFQVSTTNSDGTSTDLSQTVPINAYFKSITSIHTVLIPQGFATNPQQRMLNFVSGNMKSLQIRNGINYIPSLPILGNSGNSSDGQNNLFFIEMLKSWNKLHDHASPVGISTYNYSINQGQAAVTNDVLAYHGQNGLLKRTGNEPTVNEYAINLRNIGKCQYGITFQGEQLGMDQSTITGKRGLNPFDMLVQYTVPQNTVTTNHVTFHTYVRIDLLLHVRQDLVVQIIGK